MVRRTFVVAFLDKDMEETVENQIVLPSGGSITLRKRFHTIGMEAVLEYSRVLLDLFPSDVEVTLSQYLLIA